MTPHTRGSLAGEQVVSERAASGLGPADYRLSAHFLQHSLRRPLVEEVIGLVNGAVQGALADVGVVLLPDERAQVGQVSSLPAMHVTQQMPDHWLQFVP